MLPGGAAAAAEALRLRPALPSAVRGRLLPLLLLMIAIASRVAPITAPPRPLCAYGEHAREAWADALRGSCVMSDGGGGGGGGGGGAVMGGGASGR